MIKKGKPVLYVGNDIPTTDRNCALKINDKKIVNEIVEIWRSFWKSHDKDIIVQPEEITDEYRD